MSEKIDVDTMQVGDRYSEIEQNVYENGARHVYGVNAETGKKEHISHDKVLGAYGYGPEDAPDKDGHTPNNPNGGNKWSRPVLDTNGNPADPNWRRAGYDPINNPLNMPVGEESYEQTKRRAATWYTHVRPLYREWKAVQAGETPEGQVADDAEMARMQMERDDKLMPSEDDYRYMQWLEQNGIDNDTDRFPLPENLSGALELTRDEYVRLSSMRRRELGIGGGHSKELEAARVAYAEARNAAGAYIANAMRAEGISEDQLAEFGAAAAILELGTLKDMIAEKRNELAEGKKLSRFYKWWANQGGSLKTTEGRKGTGKKALVMGAVAFVPGLALGLAGSVVLGPVFGGAIGAALARSIARGLANAKINKEAGEYSVADAQAAHRFKEGQTELGAANVDGKVFNAEDVTAQVEKGTSKEVTRNRNRLLASVAIGAASGAIGAAVGGLLSGDPSEKLRMSSRFNPKADIDAPDFKPPEIVTSMDGRYPWTHFTEKLGGQNGTPHILELRDRAMAMGWKVNGEVIPGANNDQIVQLTDPWGRTYEGNAAINGALDYIEAQQ